MRSPLPFELDAAQVCAVIDSREQQPLPLYPLKSIVGTLTTGDYSIVGLESVIAIERKSLVDLIGCIGQERERFEREIQRLLAYPTRAVVVEAAWSELELGNWRAKVTPQAASGSVLGWIAKGVPFIFAGTRDAAAKAVSRLLYIAARRRWREARTLIGEVTGQKWQSRNAPDPDTIDSFCPMPEAAA
jgi:DNA excision repair protein ERCC-4